MKRDVEPETVAIKRERGGDILHDEERRNAGNVWFSHVSLHGAHVHVDSSTARLVDSDAVSLMRSPCTSLHRDNDLALVIRRAKMTKRFAGVAQFVEAVNDGHELAGFKALVQVRHVLVLFESNDTDGLLRGQPNPPAEDRDLEESRPDSADGGVRSARIE